MIQRIINWLADANGWSGIRFDRAPLVLPLCNCHRYGPIQYSVFCTLYRDCEWRHMQRLKAKAS